MAQRAGGTRAICPVKGDGRMLAFAERFLAAGAGGAGGTAEAERLRPALAHFAAWLEKEGIEEDGVDRDALDRYLYHLALEGANSARLDQAVDALKGYFAYRAEQLGQAKQAAEGPGGAQQSASAQGAPANPAAGLTHFSETEAERERYIRTQWALSDAFYGIRPEKEKGDA